MDLAAYIPILKTGLVTKHKGASKLLLVSYLPFLAWPVFSQITDIMLERWYTKLLDDAEVSAFFKYIDLRVSQQGRDLLASMVALHQAKNGGTVEAKRVAEDRVIRNFKNLVKLNR